MEAFYQESGRAGRDQLPSTSLLYYGVDDRKRMVGSLNLMLFSFSFLNIQFVFSSSQLHLVEKCFGVVDLFSVIMTSWIFVRNLY